MARIVHAALFSTLVALAPAAIAAEAYPQKPIRLILPFAAGGATDVLARAVSARLEEVLGASVIIDNRGGAGGTLGTALAARAAPDGYTFLFTSASHTFTPSLYKDLPYDPLRDFKAITMFASIPNLLVVHPSMPVRSVKELLALARKHPGEIRFSSGGHGSNIHLTTELFAYMARIKLEHVPYKGGGPGQVAVMSGEVQLMLPAINSAFPFVKAGRMRALGVSTKARSPALPDLPTIDESGVPGYDKASWFALFAPAAVPEAITNQVYQAAVKVLKNPEIVKLLAAEGAVAVGNSPAEFDAFVRSELVAWAKLIREMGLAR
jgi:tripartite-type tricarboxylate transporter receptor subunit TctC